MKFINSVLALLAAISLALAVAVPNPADSLGECVPGDSACRGYDLFHCSFIRPYYYEFARTCHKQCVEVDDRNAMCKESHLQVIPRQEPSEYQQQHQQSREQSATQCIPGSTTCRGTFVYQCLNLHSFNLVPYMKCENGCVSEDFQHAHCKAANDEVESHQKEKEREMKDHREQEQQELVECYPGEKVCVSKELLECTITHPYIFKIARHCPGICIEANITPPNRSASCGPKGEVLHRILPHREQCVLSVAVCKDVQVRSEDMNKRSVPASKSKRTRIINDEGAAGAAGIDESEPFTTERQGTRIINDKRSSSVTMSKRTRIINDEDAAGAEASESFNTQREGTRIINDKRSSPKDKIKRTRIINDGFMDDGEPFTSDREGTRIINDGSSGPMDKSKRTRIINDGSMGNDEPFITESQGTRIINDEASKRDAEPYYPGADLIAPHHTECEPGEGMCDKYNYTAFTCGDDGEWDVYMKCNEYSCRIDSQGQSYCRHGGTSPPGLITKSQPATTPPTAVALAF